VVGCWRGYLSGARYRLDQLMPLPLTVSYTHPFNDPLSGTTRVSRYQKCKTKLDFTEARDSEWQWHQLGHMQVCTSLQTNNHASTLLLSFLQAGCPSCRPTNSVKALKAKALKAITALSLTSVKIQMGFTFLVPAHQGSPRRRAGCVCVLLQ